MMKYEFEALMKLDNVDTEVYRRIELLYMECDLDKRDFCKKVKRCNTLYNIQNEVIAEQKAKLDKVTRYLENKKDEAREEFNNPENVRAHGIVKDKLEADSKTVTELYRNNNYLHGLYTFLAMLRTLDVLFDEKE